MTEHEFAARRFEEQRPQLKAVAYRMLGSVADAEDAVQEAWLRLARSGADDIGNLGGWLTTVVGRVCLDMLRARRLRREEPLRLPDPVVSREGTADPEQQALIADSVGLALLVVLDPDVVLRADSGAALPGGLKVVRGVTSVAGQAATFRRMATATTSRPVLVNGLAGLVNTAAGNLVSVMSFTVSGGRIVAIDILADPDRLARLDLRAAEL